MRLALVALAAAVVLGALGSPMADAAVQSSPQGNWVGAYGARGYQLAAWNGSSDLGSLPGMGLTLAHGARYAWATATRDVRALQSPDGSTRTAASYYDTTQISVQIAFSSAYSGNLHLYALDWDQRGRRETITVNDGTTSQTTALAGDFSQGAWTAFPINVPAGGTLTVNVTNNGPVNAVLSGILLGDAGTPAPPPFSTSPQGNWVGAYGARGYQLAAWNGSSDLGSLPGMGLTLAHGARYAWATATRDVRALQSPDGSTRTAASYYDTTQISVQIAFSSAYSGNLHLYALDWDQRGRRETITVNDGTTSQTTALAGDFSQGAWTAFPINVPAGGTLTVNVTNNGPVNAVLSGILLGDAGTPAPPPFSTSPQGNWVGAYGARGYTLSAGNGAGGDLSGLPNAGVTVSQGSRYVWNWCTTDARALQSPDGSTRTAASYYDATQISVQIAFSSAYSGNLHLYALDWDQRGRRETITVNDGTTSQTTALASDFSQGAWTAFPINVPAGGTLTINVTNNGPVNAVLSGILLGEGGPAPAPTAGTPTGLGNCALTSVSPGLPPLFGAGSVWNQALPGSAPVDPGSGAMIGSLAREVAAEQAANTGPWVNTDEFSSSVYVVGPNQPGVRVTLNNSTAPGAQALQSALASVPIPVYARPTNGSDHVMTILQPSTDSLWEFWQAQYAADGWHASWAGAMRAASASPGYFSSSSWPGASWSWGAGAAALPEVAGLITVADLQSGQIQHALSLAVPHPRAGAFALPAQRTDGDSTDPSSLPEGAALRLDPSLNVDALGLPPITAMIARAAQRYGIVVTNKTGSTVTFKAEDPNENGLATYFPAGPPAGSGPSPYYGPTGLFGNVVPSQFLARFPWSSLQVLQMNLQPATSQGYPLNPPPGS